MTEQARELSELSQAFDRANTSITRTGQAFGELAKSSQEWNIISRILSGTGMWRLQNQIRAVGNIINVYHNRQETARKATLEAVDANMKLVDSFELIKEKLGKTNAEIKETPLFKLFDKAGLDGIAKYKELWGDAGKAVNKALTGVKDSITPSIYARLKGGELGVGGAIKESFSGVTNYLMPAGFENTRIGGYLDNKGVLDKASEMRKNMSYTARKLGGKLRGSSIGRGASWLANTKVGKGIGGIIGKLAPIAGSMKAFFVVGALFVAKGLLFFFAIATGLAMLIFILNKMDIVGVFRRVEEKIGGFALMFSGFKDLFTGFFKMFEGAFRGDGGMLFGGILKMGKGIIKILSSLLLIAFQTILTLIGGILNGFIKIINKVPYVNIPTFADGGVSGGGLAIVGERGPELVRLPSGARVHSNSESRRMAGSNIHVHVNGRVGASDAEIRDIANKVAREINLKMNRTAHTTGRL